MRTFDGIRDTVGWEETHRNMDGYGVVVYSQGILSGVSNGRGCDGGSTEARLEDWPVCDEHSSDGGKWSIWSLVGRSTGARGKGEWLGWGDGNGRNGGTVCIKE